MRKHTLLIILLATVTLLTLVGAGCGKKAADDAAETAAENAIENATNGQADVDLGTNSIKVNTSNSSFQVGSNVTLPANFPEDVYVVDGTLTSAITGAETSSFTLTIKTTKSVSEVQSLYKQQLAAEGWSLPVDVTYADSAAVGGQKGNRSVSVTIANDTQNGGTVVGVTTSTTQTNQAPY